MGGLHLSAVAVNQLAKLTQCRARWSNRQPGPRSASLRCIAGATACGAGSRCTQEYHPPPRTRRTSAALPSWCLPCALCFGFAEFCLSTTQFQHVALFPHDRCRHPRCGAFAVNLHHGADIIYPYCGPGPAVVPVRLAYTTRFEQRCSLSSLILITAVQGAVILQSICIMVLQLISYSRIADLVLPWCG